MEGKDIKVKLGTTKKEHIDAALKKIKGLHDTFKKDLKEARHEVMQTEKILPQDQIKILEKDLNKLTTDAEESAKKVIANKEKEVKAT
jgi:ribosome recycling factor